jgi:hypothetical protein
VAEGLVDPRFHASSRPQRAAQGGGVNLWVVSGGRDTDLNRVDVVPLESCLTSKESRAVRRGAVGKVPQGNSLAVYSIACPDPWQPWVGNCPGRPGKTW